MQQDNNPYHDQTDKSKQNQKKNESPNNWSLEDEKWTCPICGEKLNNPVVTPCGHIYCFKCIDRWLLSSNRCPMCNSNVHSTDLIYIPGHSDNPNNQPLTRRHQSTPFQQIAFFVLIVFLLFFVI